MGEFCGTEPLVGEILGLRTFRIDDSGTLLPLYSDGAWYDGVNTAVCSPPTGSHHRGPHRVPADDCECGFYAYGSVDAAVQNRQTRYVQAVVSCWGDVVAGTKGVRAAHARVDALWMSPAAPSWLRARVSTRYPSARLYADAGAMLAEHPLTELDCYERPRPRRVGPVVAAVVGIAALLGLGLLPFEMLQGSTALWTAWLLVTGAVAAGTGWLMVGTHGAGHFAAAFVMAGVLAWLLAPVFGITGWVLRVPLLRGIAVAVGGYLLALRPHYFPVVRAARERAFCGVRA
ncbi:MAG: hypothetical protein ABR571_10615 [Jatrophihabitans sp.]|uniref:hypothetical protein n=1 Tax=Jatrophihabitans sp. TaxID=1932789 RepID=UPI003912FA5E